MSEQKESSVLFNLKELMGLEEERIQAEEEERRRRSERTLPARMSFRTCPWASPGAATDGVMGSARRSAAKGMGSLISPICLGNAP